jgi:hypothetical protein
MLRASISVINLEYYCDQMPITAAAQSKAWTVFAHSNAEIVGSNPTGGMNACVRLFCVLVVLCVVSGLAMGWSTVQGSGLEIREYGRRDPSRNTLYPQNLAVTSPTSGGCSVGTVRSRSQVTEFFSNIIISVLTISVLDLERDLTNPLKYWSCFRIFPWNWRQPEYRIHPTAAPTSLVSIPIMTFNAFCVISDLIRF